MWAPSPQKHIFSHQSLCMLSSLYMGKPGIEVVGTKKVKKLMVEVYSLVSSAKRYSPDFTQLPPGHRTCSFISHLKSPGSIQPGCHFRRTELYSNTSLHCPTRYPLIPRSRECTCGQSALPNSTTLEHKSAQPGIELTICRLQVAHATTDPRRPTPY